MARKNLHQTITDRIVTDLENGVAPWEKPWATGKGGALPVNLTTGNRYRGINIMILWSAAADRGFETNAWMTYRQAQSIGAQVRKGAKSETIVKVGKFLPKGEKHKPEDEQRWGTYLKGFNVFNVAEIDDVPEDKLKPYLVPETAHNPAERDDAVEAFIAATGARIEHGGDSAFYNIDSDFIRVPNWDRFKDADGYYATLLHELTHWTGHSTRCDRRFGKRFGDEAYAAEELVAEMGAAFLCAELGLPYQTQHASYLKHWARILKADNKAIFTAASAATKASDYLNEIPAEAAAA